MKNEKQVRAVIDTNLFISGLFATKGYTSELQELWITGTFELAVSENILREIKNTLLKPAIRSRLPGIKDKADEVIDLIRAKAFVITKDLYETDKIKKDHTDNKFLACALETDSDFIVSGDNHLLELKHFQGIQIVNAEHFVQTMNAK